MIHRISIENFYSVAGETVLDLRASGAAPDHPGIRPSLSTPDVKLPTVVAIYGPNAAGKSTILRALTSCVSFVVHSADLNPEALIPNFQAHFNAEWIKKPIKISIEFDAVWISGPANLETLPPPGQKIGDLFRYELELNTDPEEGTATSVRREALLYNPKGRFRRIFERTFDASYYLGKEMHIRADDARLQAVKDNASVVSTLAKLNHPLMKTVWDDLRNLQSNAWYYSHTQPDTTTIINHYRKFPDLLKDLTRKMRCIDVGVKDVRLIEAPGMPPYFVFDHDGLSQPILLREESAGTRHFLHMFPIFDFLLKIGHIGIFDEFDADLHPVLVAELLGWFRSSDRNPYRAQIFVAMHNISVLDQLEKEEIFFVEKSLIGATTIFGAQDVTGLRRDVSLEKKYRSGALGALPNIG